MGTTTPLPFGATILAAQANDNGHFAYGSGRKGIYRQKTLDAGSLALNAWGCTTCTGPYGSGVRTKYGEDPLSALIVDPVGPRTGGLRVLQGGSWFNYLWFVHSVDRLWKRPVNRDQGSGFRLAVRLRT